MLSFRNLTSTSNTHWKLIAAMSVALAAAPIAMTSPFSLSQAFATGSGSGGGDKGGDKGGKGGGSTDGSDNG